MSRPLTIGERQKLRTVEERRKSREKGTETRRANVLASEKHHAYAEGYRTGYDAGMKAAPERSEPAPKSFWGSWANWWKG